MHFKKGSGFFAHPVYATAHINTLFSCALENILTYKLGRNLLKQNCSNFKYSMTKHKQQLGKIGVA